MKLSGLPVELTLEIHISDRSDQDDFWLNQPKIINLIAFKVIEQHGFN